MGASFRIGLIADTHGLVRASVATRLAGVDEILHAGDIGGDAVLIELRTIAPVSAVWGNNDDVWTPGLSGQVWREWLGHRVLVTHGHELGRPSAAGLVARYDADVIIYGHTHRADVTRIGRQVVVNPGAAGAARFHLVPSVGILRITPDEVAVDILPLV